MIFVLTRSLEKSNLRKFSRIFSLLEDEGQEIKIFTNKNYFYPAIDCSQGTAFFALIDMNSFQWDVENPYERMDALDFPIPVVIFNDPFPLPEERVWHWISKNYMHIPRAMRGSNENHLVEVLKKISGTMKENEGPEEKSVLDMDDVKKESKLEPAAMKILGILNESAGNSVTAEKICNSMWNSFSSSQQKRLQVYISRLRKTLKAFNAEISHDEDGYILHKL